MPQRRTIVIRGPRDAVTAVPCLLGFHPERSLVTLGLGGPDGTCAIRVDLPPPGPPDECGERAEAAAEHLADVLTANRAGRALLVGYGPGPQVTSMVDAVGAALTEAGIQVVEALRVEGDRFWSYLCGDLRCCPPEGTPFDFRASAAAADAVVHGTVVLSGRDELARTVAPLTGLARESMRQATDRAERRLLGWIEDGHGPDEVHDRLVEEGTELIRSLRADATDMATTGGPAAPTETVPGEGAAAEAGPAEPVAGAPTTGPASRGVAMSDDEIAWLGVLLTHVRVRDEAWVRIDPANAMAQAGFWRMVLRRVDPRYAAAPGALLGYAAYLAGDGGLANVALDRAEAAQPGYTMAGLIRDVMLAGIPPAKAALSMTPESLAEAYGSCGLEG